MVALLHLQAPAKLNLALHIQGRRADGYHLLESLVVFTEFGDTLSIAAADRLQLTIQGEFATEAGEGEHNLVLRAAKALQSATDCYKGARITLTKNIPVGAGLGGGSADAAAVLHGLQQLWKTELSADRLAALALPLGADIPMCLLSKPLIARGVGEVLAPLPQALPPLHVVLVHPRTPLLSGDVYRALNYPLDVARESDLQVPDHGDGSSFTRWLATTRNDLQPPAMAISPIVAELLLAMETAQPSPLLVRMTGSGACCFALFSDAQAAERYARQVQAQYPQWWVKNTKII